MNPLFVQTDGNQADYRPGDIVRGVIRWQYDTRPGRIELRLIWFTEGPGPDDVKIVDTLVQEDPLPADACVFQFRLPDGPFSYNGNSFRVRWALELLAPGRKDCVRLNVIVSPTNQPITVPFH
ncbi:MAG: hypothetical protein GX455_12075 [Phycisphaerae bacterium]|nr:hypothetical protein [Phycisphaerae bacterium]